MQDSSGRSLSELGTGVIVSLRNAKGCPQDLYKFGMGIA